MGVLWVVEGLLFQLSSLLNCVEHVLVHQSCGQRVWGKHSG